MEKELPNFDNITLDSLIDLLDSPADLNLKITELKQTSHPLSDEVEGFIMYYELYKGDTEKIKKKIETLEHNFNVPKKTKRMIPIRWAAIFILVIGCSVTFYYFKSNNSQQITAPYEEIGLPNYMGENKTSNIDWKNVMFLYKTKQYRKLTEIQNKQSNDTLSYFQGIASIKEKNLELGIKKLSEIPLKSHYYNKSLYFKCISFLKMNKPEKVKSLLTKINKELNDPEFNEKVIELRKLN